MKISASIYSDKKRPLKDVILDLVAHQVDLLHVDCNDDVSVFEDIKKIRTWCNLPIDLHIITPYPSKYKDLISDTPVEYVTFQYEDLKEKIEFPSNFSGKKGLAVITPTDVAVFQEYEDFDFMLVMATIPGQSGGVFDTFNFSKIRKFKKMYPTKSLHVDGGVNGEVSFILRNMGVSSSVSGSYLFNGPSIGHALMNLTKRNVESQFVLRDFMIPLAETPVIHESNLSFKHILETIERGKLGFALVVRENNEYVGLVSNADVRKSLLNSIDDLTNLNVNSMINRDSIGIQDTATVNEMLQLIKKYAFPITYLPVLDEAKNAVGIVTFVNLIRGEI
jgi:pentose-5-phosphate-3-epimerase/predicted transcriptional regulator